MKRTIKLSTFRKIHNLEVEMIRAAMPRVSEADTAPVPFAADGSVECPRQQPRATRTITATIAEAARFAELRRA